MHVAHAPTSIRVPGLTGVGEIRCLVGRPGHPLVHRAGHGHADGHHVPRPAHTQGEGESSRRRNEISDLRFPRGSPNAKSVMILIRMLHATCDRTEIFVAPYCDTMDLMDLIPSLVKFFILQVCLAVETCG